MTSSRLRKDMRRHDRAPVELPVIVTDTANRVVGGIRFEAKDFSAGGAFLRSDLLFEVGEQLKLEIQLPGGRLVHAGGRVVRVSRDLGDDRVPGMGMEFISLSPEDRTAIQAFLRSS